ncbi:MAG: 2-phosphosulfolactate phosphatase [Anaerolineae bacterium]|nr:2-phosphosulfolactate phosphatase [Anaerolineae bacterium]
MDWDQAGYDVRCEWGLQGIIHLAPTSDVVIIVDVLSFSTCVDVAVSRGARVFPYSWKDERAEHYARERGAVLATSNRSAPGYSLSPVSLRGIPAGTRLVLPSPNGATLSLATGETPTLCGCLRNAAAVALAAAQIGTRITVIPAGERWPDGSLRPALEDWIGAGAIIAGLPGSRSPEAQLAEQAFQQMRHALPEVLLKCASGQELVRKGFPDDVLTAAAWNVSSTVPRLQNESYQES